MFQDFGSAFLGGFGQGADLAQQALLNALRQEQAETQRMSAEARIAEGEARTKAIESDLATTAAQQKSALDTLLGFEGDFLSSAAQGFFESIGDAEDPFADATVLARAPSVLQQEALARITSQAVGGPEGAATVIEEAEPGDLTFGGFQQLQELAGLGDEEAERIRKRLFPTQLERETEREAIAQKRLSTVKLGIAGAALNLIREGQLTFNDLARTQNPLLVIGAQSLDIGADIRQFRTQLLESFSIRAEIDKSLRNTALSLMERTGTTGQFPVQLVMQTLSGGFESLSAEGRQKLAPLAEQLELERTRRQATLVGAIEDTPEQKVASAIMKKALADGDAEVAQKMAQLKNKIATDRMGPEVAQFFPTFEISERARILGIPVPFTGGDVTGITPSLPLGPIEQKAYLLMEAAGGSSEEAITQAITDFNSIDDPTAAERESFEATIRILGLLREGAQ